MVLGVPVAAKLHVFADIDVTAEAAAELTIIVSLDFP